MKTMLGNIRGAALIEFVIVVVILITLVFGIIEFGLIIKDQLTLNQAVREGVRSAALGSPLETVEARVLNSAPTLNTEAINSIELYKRPADVLNDGWILCAENDTLPGEQVRVHAEYPHNLATGSLFSWIVGGTTIELSADMVMRRE